MQLLMLTDLKSYTERHLPYGITQCYLPHDTGERGCPSLGRRYSPVLDLPIPKGWKAELT